MFSFKTHTGEEVTGERLNRALNNVAEELIQLYNLIYKEDEYAAHVTEEIKLQDLKNGLFRAEDVRKGVLKSFMDWQLVDTELTGECITFLNE